jgi:hypothetical protein
MSDRKISTTPAMGTWNEQKEKLIAKFPELTDDDLYFVEGKRVDMLNSVALKLNMSKEELETIIKTL